MRRLATLAVVAALLSPTAASGQNYTFGDWARDHGYLPGDVMPSEVDATSRMIDSLDGISEFDWTSTPTTWLWLHENRISSIESGNFSGLANLTALTLHDNRISNIESGAFSGLTNLPSLALDGNQLSSIESGTFSGLTNLTALGLWGNQISSIESGAFSGLANLTRLDLQETRLTELNLAGAEFANLEEFDVRSNENIASVSLENAVVSQSSLAALLVGIGDLDGVNELHLSGIDFANITDLEPLCVMDDLTDLWLVNTHSLDAIDLDLLLDNLATIEGTGAEGILHMTEANFDAFNAAGGGRLETWHAEPGHRVAFVGAPAPLLGDLNLDGEVNGLDVDPFVDILLDGPFWPEADMNEDRRVNGLDVDPFVAAVGDGGAQQIPEPSTLLLGIIALGVVGGWRKWAWAA